MRSAYYHTSNSEGTYIWHGGSEYNDLEEETELLKEGKRPRPHVERTFIILIIIVDQCLIQVQHKCVDKNAVIDKLLGNGRKKGRVKVFAELGKLEGQELIFVEAGLR